MTEMDAIMPARPANGSDELGSGTRHIFARPPMRTWMKFKLKKAGLNELGGWA
ncbi:MAG: hypothetical protein WBE85_08145 [Methylocella sp.]